jgi:hypothetical protein
VDTITLDKRRDIGQIIVRVTRNARLELIPMQHPTRGAVLLLASIAILGSAILHGMVNVPHLHEDLLEIGVRPRLVTAIVLVLYFSVAAMFTFGGLVFSSAVQVFRGQQPSRAVLSVIAANYIGFGMGAFALMGGSPHLLGYAGMGLLVAVGAALSPPRASNQISDGWRQARVAGE